MYFNLFPDRIDTALPPPTGAISGGAVISVGAQKSCIPENQT